MIERTRPGLTGPNYEKVRHRHTAPSPWPHPANSGQTYAPSCFKSLPTLGYLKSLAGTLQEPRRTALKNCFSESSKKLPVAGTQAKSHNQRHKTRQEERSDDQYRRDTGGEREYQLYHMSPSSGQKPGGKGFQISAAVGPQPQPPPDEEKDHDIRQDQTGRRGYPRPHAAVGRNQYHA